MSESAVTGRGGWQDDGSGAALCPSPTDAIYAARREWGDSVNKHTARFRNVRLGVGQPNPRDAVNQLLVSLGDGEKTASGKRRGGVGRRGKPGTAGKPETRKW